MKKTVLLFVLGFIVLLSSAQTNEKRLALVIGNAAYQNGGALKNPVNDANLIASTLQGMGFDVEKITNATLRQMQVATANFTNKIKNYDVALFFYAGHGVQVDGKNYLIPIDAKMDNRTMAKFEAMDINFVNDAFLLNQGNINIMILDACRNDPFRSWTRGGERGFKKIDRTAKGTIIGFATQPGETAADGTGKNGLYTSMLVEQMKKPQDIEDVFKNTRIAVNSASTEGQLPQEWSSLMGNFYFVEPTGNAAPTQNTGGLIVGTVEQEYGEILIDSDIAGKLYIDGDYKGNLAANSRGNRLPQQPTGNHSIKLVGSNETITEFVTVYNGQPASVTLKSSAETAMIDRYLTDPRDGKKYKKVKIGNQVWMAENLAYKPSSGNYWAYDNSSSNVDKYGYLYDLETAKKVCPSGWHLPSDAEWDQLAAYISNDKNTGEKESDGDWTNIGKNLKSKTGWSDNGNGTDDYGFCGLPGGGRGYGGDFYYIGDYGYWWSASEDGADRAWYRYLSYGGSYFGRYYGFSKSWGFSVRCVRD